MIPVRYENNDTGIIIIIIIIDIINVIIFIVWYNVGNNINNNIIMPICPRCGKSLTSDQALNYHLNRKFRCGIWNCTRCNINFNTKHQLTLHEIQCGDVCRKHNHPSTDTLLNIYNNIPLPLIEFDVETNKIVSVSPTAHKLLENQFILGEKLLDVFDINDINIICKNICILINKDKYKVKNKNVSSIMDISHEAMIEVINV